METWSHLSSFRWPTCPPVTMWSSPWKTVTKYYDANGKEIDKAVKTITYEGWNVINGTTIPDLHIQGTSPPPKDLDPTQTGPPHQTVQHPSPKASCLHTVLGT